VAAATEAAKGKINKVILAARQKKKGLPDQRARASSRDAWYDYNSLSIESR
jgi:hypothetical protein